jgi:hypothetical protein
VTVSLTNTSGRCLVFVLAHKTYCEARGECRCDVEPGRRARRIARSLTLASGVTSLALDDAVLTVPDVVRAVKRGDLSVKRHASELPKPVAAPTPPPTSLPEIIRPDVKAPTVKTKNKRGAS